MTKNIADITLADAFARLALELTDNQKVIDPMTGTETEENKNLFIVRKMLNGICYSTEVTLGYSLKSADKARFNLKKALTEYTGDELSKEALDKAKGWCERIVDQQALLTNFLVAAKHAHEEFTGETYVDAATQAAIKKSAQHRIERDPHLADARKLLEALEVRTDTRAA